MYYLHTNTVKQINFWWGGFAAVTIKKKRKKNTLIINLFENHLLLIYLVSHRRNTKLVKIQVMGGAWLMGATFLKT